jgi:hypothetical protein
MKKLILITFALATTLTVGSSSVLATTTTASPAASTASTATAIHTQDFATRKAKILQRISDRLAKVQQIQSCVQAANDFQSMRACKPHRDKGEHGVSENHAG